MLFIIFRTPTAYVFYYTCNKMLNTSSNVLFPFVYVETTKTTEISERDSDNFKRGKLNEFI